MKKIFAIALAAVMVLSMASAFALSDCYANFAWPCDPDVMYCGRGTVEVVPVVKVNAACGGSEYQINECAGAVAGETIYFAIKLNVDANPDFAENDDRQESNWWDVAELSIVSTATTKAGNPVVDFDENVPTDAITFDVEDGIDWDATKAKSYYLLVEPTVVGNDEDAPVVNWVDVTTDDLDLDDVVFTAEIDDDADASKAKVCAVLESYCDGYGTWVYGDYTVEVAEDETSELPVLTVSKADGSIYTYEYNEETGRGVVSATADFAKEVEKLFNLAGCSLGTCLTDANIEKNFGWNNTVEDETEIEDCFTWSAKASAIVDAECVVAIPKTGDASLLAWLF